MASPFRSPIFNVREEALSSDLGRISSLGSKALQDELLYGSLDSNGNPISAFTKTPTLVGNAATFTTALGVGEAMVYDASGVGADDSAYKVVQWVAQNLTFANPDPTNPRIDLVCLTPGTVATDNSTRNVLQDAVLRTFAPALLPKTLNPTVVPVVVTGTPGATPAPPAVPAGAAAIFEVAVPAAATDAVAFLYYQRIFRKTAYPLTGGINPSNPLVSVEAPVCGVLRGCSLLYPGTFEALSQGSSGQAENAVVIDGEVIHFATAASNAPGSSDSLANPFAAPAPAGNDVPFFLYLMGGRNAPQGYPNAYPVVLIASLTPPNTKTGRPSANIANPRGGSTQSAVYVGIGFVKKGTSNHQTCYVAGGMVWFAGTGGGGFETYPLGAGAATPTFASHPSISDRAQILLANIAGAGLILGVLPSMGTALNANCLFAKNYGGATSVDGPIETPIVAGAGPHLDVTAGVAVDIRVLAYSTNVRRLG